MPHDADLIKRCADRMAKALAFTNDVDFGVSTLADGAVEIRVYDVIGMGFISPEQVAVALIAAGDATVHLRINSPGGDADAARAIKARLDEYPGRVEVHVDGQAASAASYIMTAGDVVTIAEGGTVMIHKSFTMTLGNEDEHRAKAQGLAAIDQAMVADYVRKSGQPAENVRAMMATETTLTAEDALRLGFVDEIRPARVPPASAQAPAPEPAAGAASAAAAHLGPDEFDVDVAALQKAHAAAEAAAAADAAAAARERRLKLLAVGA